MDVSNAPVIPPSKFSKSSKVITKERWVAGVRPWQRFGFVITWQANIYQVSGLSPTPSLVEHNPSTRGSPDTYHYFVVVCNNVRQTNVRKHTEEKVKSWWQGLQTDQWGATAVIWWKYTTSNWIGTGGVNVCHKCRVKIQLAETCLELRLLKQSKNFNNFTPPPTPRPLLEHLMHKKKSA